MNKSQMVKAKKFKKGTIHHSQIQNEYLKRLFEIFLKLIKIIYIF